MEVSDLPSLNAALNFSSAVLLSGGYYFIRRRNIRAHKTCMTAAVLTSAAFLTSYLIYHYHAGSVPYMKLGWTRPLYYFILVTHIVLAIVNLPMVLRTTFLAFKSRFPEHRAIARWTFPIWMYVSITGVLVYWMLYHT